MESGDGSQVQGRVGNVPLLRLLRETTAQGALKDIKRHGGLSGMQNCDMDCKSCLYFQHHRISRLVEVKTRIDSFGGVVAVVFYCGFIALFSIMARQYVLSCPTEPEHGMCWQLECLQHGVGTY